MANADGGVRARRSLIRDLIGRATDRLAGKGEHAGTHRAAGGAFLFRVVNAGLGIVSQILFARWMGEFQYGVYAYVWVWVLVLGGTTSLGFPSAPQRFIPEYLENGRLAELRGFLLGSRLVGCAFSSLLAGLGLAALWLYGDWLAAWYVVPLYLAAVCVPLYALVEIQDGVARSYGWIGTALGAPYLIRPLLILLLIVGAFAAGLPPTAEVAMAATTIGVWLAAIWQLVALERRLAPTLPAGPRAYEFRRWFAMSLPVLLVDACNILLLSVDVLILEIFRGPDQVAVYFAATKLMAIVAFVAFAVSAAAGHRYTAIAVTGDRARLQAFVDETVRMTFWPSLAAIGAAAVGGWPFLWLFGPSFTAGYPLVFILGLGFLARAAVGPAERLLSLLGAQQVCAAIYVAAVTISVALNFILVPRLGLYGAATATATAFVVESILLFVVVKRRLGIHAFVFGTGSRDARAEAGQPTAGTTGSEA